MKKNTVQFYDVIAASRVVQNPIAGTLGKDDLREGLRIKIVGLRIGGSREQLATVTSSKVVKRRGGDYMVEVVFDSHMLLAHPERQYDGFGKCCYQILSLRDIGILKPVSGLWDPGLYTTLAPE